MDSNLDDIMPDYLRRHIMYKDVTKELRHMYTYFVEAGFTEEQSFELIKTILLTNKQ